MDLLHVLILVWSFKTSYLMNERRHGAVGNASDLLPVSPEIEPHQ